MRALIWTIIAGGAVFAALPAMGQTYNPNYPVCIQRYLFGSGSYIDCSFTSMAQCYATASGLAAQCYANPYYAPHKRSRRR
jgi:hypothetical protein